MRWRRGLMILALCALLVCLTGCRMLIDDPIVTEIHDNYDAN